MSHSIRNFVKKRPLLYSLAKKIKADYRQVGSKKKWKNLLKNSSIKLEVGSWKKYGTNGWTTVDLEDSDICWDLRRGIPLPSESVDKIYSSHLLEHIPYQQLILFLNECRRVLKAGGEFSVCVPNFRFYIDAYIDGNLAIERDAWWQPGSIDTGSSMDQLNYQAYMRDDHKYMFDEENLINTLKKGGFSEAKLRNFDQELDLRSREIGSIYAVANK